MGCCISSTKAAADADPHPPTTSKHCHYSPPQPPTPESHKTHLALTIPNTRAPPPPPPPPQLEEETVVKEVLSETPIPKPTSPKTEDKNRTKGLILIDSKDEQESPEISQVSEMYSATESYSTVTTATTATTTVTEKREDEATSKRVTRSPSKIPRKRPYTGELAGGRERAAKSPARRAEPPVKRGQVTTRSVRGRELSGSQVRTTQRNVGSAGVQRDPGEGSGRRSRSPATRNASGVGRGGRGASPSKVTVKGGGRSTEVGVDSKAKKTKEEQNNGTPPQQGGESIDNPHVALECFIFL